VTKKIGHTFCDVWCINLNGAEMMNLQRYHQYSQENKNYGGEESLQNL
jgi:hypothetical protein